MTDHWQLLTEWQRGYHHRGREGDQCEEGDTEEEGRGGKEPCGPQRLSLEGKAKATTVISQGERKQKQEDWSEGR